MTGGSAPRIAPTPPGGQGGGRSLPRRVAAIVFFDLAALALLFLAGEIVVRCLREKGIGRGLASFAGARGVPADPGTKGYFLPDRDLGHRLNPDAPDVNALGFRGEEVLAEKPADVFRVLIVGDSVSWYREGWVKRFREGLASRPGKRIEVLNAAVPGYTTWQERLLLERLIGPVRPDLVVLQHCLNDNHRLLHVLTVDGGWLMTQDARATLLPEGGGVLARFSRWSYLAFEIRRRLLALSNRASPHPWKGHVDFGAAWLDSTWGEARENVIAIRDLARVRGAHLVVVSVPFEPQLDPARLADRDETLKPQRRLAAICGELGIPLVDLEPLFEARGGRGLFTDGVHLSDAGCEIASSALRERLESERLLP